MKNMLSRVFGGWMRPLLVCLLFALCSLGMAEKIKLRITVWDGDAALRALRQCVTEFEKAHPNIEVQLESIEYNNYFNKILVQYAGNVAPDVVMMAPEFFQKFAKRGTLYPLQPFFGQVPGFDINAYYPEITRAMEWKGDLYVLPRDIAPIGMVYYNKRLFDQAGIPYPDGSWTWDFEERPELREKDFLWVLRNLTKKNAQGKVSQYALSAAWPGALLDTFIYSSGGWYAKDDLEAPTKLGYTDPKTVRAFEFMQDLMLNKRYIPSPNELSSAMSTTADQVFTQQKAAMYVTGIWDVPKIREALSAKGANTFDWDVALVPAFKDGTRAMPTGGSGYSIMRSTRHPKEAWLLTTWMAGEPGMLAMAKAGIAQPALKELAQKEPWIPGPNTPADQQIPRNRIITHQAVPFVKFNATADYWQEVIALAGAPVDQIWNGTAKPKDALAEGQARAEVRLKNILADRDRPIYNWNSAVVVGVIVLGAILAWIYWPERKIKYTSREKRESRVAYWFIAPWIVGMLVFTIGPMVLSLMMSFANWDILTPAQWRGAENYTEAFTVDPGFYKSLRVTFIYAFVSVPLGLMGSLLLALLLNAKVRGIPIYRTCFYIPSLASAVAASLIWRKIFQQEGGIVNTIIYGPNGDGNFLGLATLLQGVAPPGQMVNWLGDERTALASIIIMSVWGVGGGMVILLAGLQGIPQFYYEAATLDGAGPIARFKAVTWPMLTPSLFFSLITGFIGAFQVFAQAFVITGGGPNDSTRFFMLHMFDAAFRYLRMGYASALAWILFAIILIFTLFQLRLQKYVYYEGGETR